MRLSRLPSFMSDTTRKTGQGISIYLIDSSLAKQLMKSGKSLCGYAAHMFTDKPMHPKFISLLVCIVAAGMGCAMDDPKFFVL